MSNGYRLFHRGYKFSRFYLLVVIFIYIQSKGSRTGEAGTVRNSNVASHPSLPPHSLQRLSLLLGASGLLSCQELPMRQSDLATFLSI